MADLAADTISEVTHEGITVLGRNISDAQLREESGAPAKESKAVEPEPLPAASTATPTEPKENAQQKHDRIQRLTYEREEERRRADTLAAENARLKAPPAPVARAKPRIDQFEDTDPQDPKPTQADFEDSASPYDDWVIATSQWNARQAYKAEQRKSFESARQERVAKQRYEVDAAFVTALDAHKAKHPAFEAKVSASDMQLSKPIVDGIKAAKAPELLEYLVDHPEEHARIEEMAPIDRYSEMKLLAVRLQAAPAGSAVVARPTTKAEPPINPVGSSHVVVKDEGPPGDDASDEDWFKWNDSQKQKARKRA